MNSRFDIVIIGDSKDGNSAVKRLAAASATLKIAFISYNFKCTTTRDFLNVEYIADNVVFIDYKNRLFGCYLQSGDAIFCTHLIIASGIKYAPFLVNGKEVPNVLNTAEYVDRSVKHLPAAVIGNSNADAKFALAVSKKYKHVYLCSDTISLSTTESTNKKLMAAKNIVILPNARVIKVTKTEKDLLSVELDNYSTVTCANIFIKTPTTPDTDFVPEKLVSKTLTGHLEVDTVLQSLVVPKCYAIGNCASKCTNKMKESMFNNILKDFGGNLC